ncbi:MAG: hypothetical protein KAY32_11395 [Candidatus Eisenbacteria sp.]|nr:hypothetical protein [Candidatus Eisenbacteria bacterium]
MRKRGQTKGIFCIEGLWDSDLRVTSTVRPLLELLRLNEGVNHIHREYATRDEFEFYVRKWAQKKYEAYPILYLTTHGMEGGLLLEGEFYSIEQFSALLEGKCANRVIMLSSCSTLKTTPQHLTEILTKTAALAVCGYRVDVDWMRSTAFELLLFSRLQDSEFSGRGAEAIQKEATEIAKAFEDLEFKMVASRDCAK